MNTRINLIMNGKQNICSVIDNLRKLFDGDDKVLFYTKSEFSEFKNAITEKLGFNDEEFCSYVSYTKFNEVDYKSVKENCTKKIIGIKMPNSLFHNISKAYNDAFKFVDNTEIAEYIHVFADDCKIVSDNYNPEEYEWFMSNFNENFIMDSKLNQGNYAFKKYSPRFVFMSRKFLHSPVSFVQFESKDHFIINRKNFKQNFDEKVKRMYIPEFVIRAHKDNVIRHTSFYPDPILETWVKRDDSLPFTTDIGKLSSEYQEDEKYIKEILKTGIAIENSVDPIIGEMTKVIKERFSECEAESPKISIPSVSL